ncbi:MAG: hypothetical protein JNM98_06155 [Rhodocyclaceae bacterium]|nr:hypothetical protein [Rhodocyclaceae bacterium]
MASFAATYDRKSSPDDGPLINHIVSEFAAGRWTVQKVTRNKGAATKLVKKLVAQGSLVWVRHPTQADEYFGPIKYAHFTNFGCSIAPHEADSEGFLRFRDGFQVLPASVWTRAELWVDQAEAAVCRRR